MPDIYARHLQQLNQQSVVVIDVETTGLSPKNGDRIIEIGAVRIAGGAITETFQRLIAINTPIPAAAQAVHGISARMLIGQPPPAEVFTDFRHFIGQAPLVAHNAPFDMRFLTAEFNRLGFDLPNPSFCTLKLARLKYPRLLSYKLESVARYLGADSENLRTHRALDDATLAARVWLRLFETKLFL